MYKPKFESREYNILESTQEYIHFFNTQDSNLYEIRMNNQEETKSKKGDLSLWNHTTKKRVSGLYRKPSKNQVFTFDYLGEVFYLEINSNTINIQYLHKKQGYSPLHLKAKKQPKNSHKPHQTSNSPHELLRVGLW
jgi:hypothetical protein